MRISNVKAPPQKLKGDISDLLDTLSMAVDHNSDGASADACKWVHEFLYKAALQLTPQSPQEVKQ